MAQQFEHGDKRAREIDFKRLLVQALGDIARGFFNRPAHRHGEVVFLRQRGVDKPGADQGDGYMLGVQVDAQRFHQVAHGGLGGTVGFCTWQWHERHRAAHPYQLSAVTQAQQGQSGFDAVTGREQVGAHHAFDHRRLEGADLDIFAGASIKDGAVQRTPDLGNVLTDAAYLRGIAEAAGPHQYLLRIALGQCLQRLKAAGTEGQALALFEQLYWWWPATS